MKTGSQPAGLRLRRLLKRKKTVVSVGVHDVFTGLLAEREGFDTVFVGGFGASASLLGRPDTGLLTPGEMAAFIRRLTDRIQIPVIADGDTGHGGPHQVQQTVRLFEDAGAAGILIEDQEDPKRCGHFEGKNVVPVEEMALRLNAAKDAIQDKSFYLIARTDARDVLGIDEAIRRAKIYKKLGADMVFVESPGTRAELARIGKEINAPLLANMLTGGKTPPYTVKDAERWGYNVAVYPIESLLMAARGFARLSKAIRKSGSVSPLKNDMIDFRQIKDILGWEAAPAAQEKNHRLKRNEKSGHQKI